MSQILPPVPTQKPAGPGAARKTKMPHWGVIAIYGVVIVFLALLSWRLIDVNTIISKGQEVPAFTLTTFDNQEINTQDLRGKVILVNVWASWCIPCENEAGYLEQAWQYYQPGGQVVFLGVNWKDIEPKAQEYMQRFAVSYLNGPDYSERIGRIFRVTGVPETYIIDQEGRLAFILKGEFVSLEHIRSAIDPLLEGE
jgi:cytochrome c biogenesis protein CcmG/thiol:disulfide interchange protein DsbE